MPIPKLMCIAGARPNFVKIAPILKVLETSQSSLMLQFIHTGQHYDSDLDASFFASLEIRQPDENLEVHSGTHAEQTALIMQRFEPIIERYQPDAVLVVGDVNSTLACSLVAVKKAIPVIHVEAGLRSFDDSMPEEINRKLTDQITALHFITEQSAKEHLLKEGISPAKIHFVGNVMIDSLFSFLPKVKTASEIINENGLSAAVLAKHYGIVTLHRPSNVDDKAVFENILTALQTVSQDLPLIFPMHPRTQQKIKQFRLESYFNKQNLIYTKPLNYLEILGLMKTAKLVFTDSGGIQEETSVLKVPCLTLRENTERPITLEKGSNHLVGINPQNIIKMARQLLEHPKQMIHTPPLWDGKAAHRIAEILVPWMHEVASSKKEQKVA
ncbi:UDP-N-acetylglucosamine 2-epimerase (non-hydrolyzing) [Candidatus Berkiella cookevillensis]|uniref:UDP-2,3-diacetamido-2,3-dideoxy-D-glucuronate 2-epimerase n=1 Tax=Candidatus Berkiella cookevillensis TaxID=437022 RepID=A0A0Q9YBE4_9GAMM|nr:UDP-N-acetylglucosamine 2-epimerase (non-hydrolyzing) [Candidatus Berkiella cookevillensis]MCS5709136.1 UDP-N-acetylglucosamine 2-epimerase (non-hydrolyzing) [Candidatus Berkiella cookevillensis]